MAATKISLQDLPTALAVEVTLPPQFHVRVAIAVQLIRLAGWITKGMIAVKVVTAPTKPTKPTTRRKAKKTPE